MPQWLVVLALGWLGGCAGSSGPEAVPALERHFVGSAACADCHPAPTAAWARSHHHLAERPVEAGDPALAEGALVLDGVAHRPVGVIGVAPLRQYLIGEARGRLQVSQQAWDPEKAELFDVFADGRQPGEWGHWTGRGMTWNAMCASCHNTGLRKGYDPGADRYDTTRAEQGVGCEACHGPGSVHVDGGPAPVADPGVDTCGACHARAAPLDEDFAPGDAFLDHYALTLPDATGVYWPDGQVQDEDFEYAAFRGSKMYEAGVRCVDCHDPHSGQLKREGDALCLDCHARQEGFAAHDGHEGEVDCVDCHMPTTTYMQRHPRRDHGFTIPDPLMTAELGIPNACDRCHADTAPPDWATYAGPQRARARAFAALRTGAEDARDRLLGLVRDDPHPYWRAAAAASLTPWAGDPAVEAALAPLAAAENPLLRYGAAGVWTGPDLMADPLRAVRVTAQRRHLGRKSASDPSMADLRAYLELHRDQPAQAAELGSWWVVSGEVDRGLAEIRRAIALDPGAPVLRADLARALAQVGRGGEALTVLNQAVTDHPDDAELHYLRALGQAGAGDIVGAIASFERVVTLDPTRTRAWYNLGLARQQADDLPGAIAALQRAEQTDPTTPDPAYALAVVLLQAGRTAEAKEAVARCLAIEPSHGAALKLQAAFP